MRMTCLFYLALLLFSCKKDPLQDKLHFRGSIYMDGIRRTYLINLPPHYYQDAAYFPLVIGLHGLGGDAIQFERDYHFTDKSNSAGFIALYPEGVESNGILGLRSWNAGNCCDYAMDQHIDDVKFIRTLMDQLSASYRVDTKRIYVTGMSNGAMMTYRLACELSDKIAAIAPVSGTLVVTQPCAATHVIPVLHIHSEIDTKVPYAGGIGLAGYYFPPVDSGLQVWAKLDSCGPMAAPARYTDYTINIWPNSVYLYLTQDGGHAWPGGLQSTAFSDPPSTAFNATDLIWDFFARYSLPE